MHPQQLFCILFLSQGVALGYFICAPLGRRYQKNTEEFILLGRDVP